MSEGTNTTTNETQPLNCFSNSTAEKIGKASAYCLIFLVSLVGNSLVGIIVYKTRTMRKPINLLMVNMAMFDLLFTSFIIPTRIIELYVESWLISGFPGKALCKLVPFTFNAAYYVSVQSLVLIAVNRFGAVVFPLHSPLISSKLCPFFILATWIVAMAAKSPDLISNNLVEYPVGLKCVGVFTGGLQVSPSYKNYVLVEFVVFLVTPLVLVGILYTIIYFKVKTLTIPDEQSANERQPLIRREQTVLKVATAIVLCLAMCCLPYSIVWILFNFVTADKWSCGVQYFAKVAWFMSYAYSAINSCILFLFSKNYRQSLRNIVRCF